MKLTKISGWILLTVGLVIIFWTLYSSYNIFTGKTKVPEIFRMEAKETETPTKVKTPSTQNELQKELERMLGEQLKTILPVDVLSKLLNLISFSILTGILIFGGSQIAGLGIKLLKI